VSASSPSARARRELRDARRSLSPERREPAEAEINRQVIELLDGWPVGVVAGYSAIDGEADLEPTLATLRRSGRSTAYPVTHANHRMTFRLWDGAAPRAIGRHGITEPAGPMARREDIAAVIVPMVGFTVHGDRLGYGAGYYDRYLATSPRPILIGVAFDLQELTEAQRCGHDIAMDIVVTETRRITL